MPPFTPSQSSSCKRGNGGSNSAKGRTLLLVAVCASLTPSTSAFTVGNNIRGPAHLLRTSSSQNQSSSAVSSSSSPQHDEEYFFTAPPEPQTQTQAQPQPQPVHDKNGEGEPEKNTLTSIKNDFVSTEQTELQAMEFATTEEDLLSTTSAVAAAAAAAPYIVPSPVPIMDVDGNGTGAMMGRAGACGGVDATLMATNPSLAFPIDSGKVGMQARDIRARTRGASNDGIIDRAQPRTRLVRYSLPASDGLEATQGPTQKKLVLAPALSKNGMSSELTTPPQQQTPPKGQMQPQKPRLVRYNGPDIEDSTDHDGMELPHVQKNRNRELKLKRANLVMYNGESQQKRLTEEVPSDTNGDAIEKSVTTEDDHQKGRKTLVEDVGYANRYTALSDYNLARKTGLAVNKPISLWVERDKFL